MARVDTFLHELTRQYRVNLIDARTWAPEEDFADGVHLIHDGARRVRDHVPQDDPPVAGADRVLRLGDDAELGTHVVDGLFCARKPVDA